MLYPMHNPIQNYAWGSTTSLNQLFGIDNPEGQPQAEVWMGAHPNGCSQIEIDGTGRLLSEHIAQNPTAVLGESIQQRFGNDLPYLVKLLAAAQPLSIQVHPEKSAAQAGFERENAEGIPLDAAHRNYKDPNHKPELVYALTPYLAMNAFRELDEMVSLFEQSGITLLDDAISTLKASRDLQGFFNHVMRLEGENKTQVVAQLLDNVAGKGTDDNARLAFNTVALLAEFYPGDIGLLSPLMLNVIELQPGEAMFLDAQTPHAYLRGTGVEVMANSDNVLRAGLTPKFMDLDELISSTRFTPVPLNQLRTTLQTAGGVSHMPVPVPDFIIDRIMVNSDAQTFAVNSAEILLCLEGSVQVASGEQQLSLKAGESLFVEACSESFSVEGDGVMVRVLA